MEKINAPIDCNPSGSGVSFAIRPFRQMPLYRQLLNETFGAAETASSSGEQLASPAGASAGVARRSDREASRFGLHDGPGRAYNEEAFQYFLEIERKRSELSNRPFLLMLVDFKHPGIHPRIDAVTVDKLFSMLSLCLRETDFIGWYREGRVAGAVLTQHGETEGDDLSDVVRRRIGGALRQRLPADPARLLQVRVYQLPPNAMSRSEQ